MTASAAVPGNDPHELLSRNRALARQVRTSQRSTWFALLVLAAVTFAAIPVDWFGHRTRSCRVVQLAELTGQVCRVYTPAAFVYWPIALVLAYGLIAAFYFGRAAARGVGTRVRPYVVVGVLLAVVATAVAWWSVRHAPIGQHDILGYHTGGQPSGLINRIAGPACAIGLGLLVLSWIERSVSLLVVSVGYLVIVLAPVDFGWTMHQPSRWVFLPRLVIDGSVLLIAAAGFALAEWRGRRRPA